MGAMTRRTKRIGRPTKLTAKVQKILLEGLEVGMTFDGAATRAGITERTRQNWWNRGEEVYHMLEEAGEDGVELGQEDDIYLRFFLAHNEAVAKGQFAHWVNLENHMPNDPKVSMWVLERRYGIGMVQRHEITGAEGGAIEVKSTGDSDDERAARILAILEAAKARRGEDGA